MRSPKSIAEDVANGLAVLVQLQGLEEELAGIEARLVQDALDRPEEHQPLADAEREGRQFIARSGAVELPIVFTADKLVGTFAEESKVAKRIMDAIPWPKFDAFYKKVTSYAMVPKDGKKFRSLAADLLGEEAPRFIAACRAVDKDGIPKSDIKVEWEAAAASKGMEVAA